jgi:hypothetical protein
MKQTVRTITQVFLAVLLTLSLGFLTAGPSMAQESAQESASISPPTEVYDLDNTPDFIQTSITWGGASNITGITDNKAYDLNKGWGNDYKVLVNHLLILDRYLKYNLTEDGESVALNIAFDDDTVATFTITADQTHPTIDPKDAYYNVNRNDDVETTITWRYAEKIKLIEDGDHYELEEDMDYTLGDTIEGEATLTILSDAYLDSKLTAKNQSVVLTIQFDFGDDATFNITATNKPLPYISPKEAKYDLDNPAPVSTTIWWGAAMNITSIQDDDDYVLVKGEDYSGPIDSDANEATRTVFNSTYITGKDIDIGDSIVLTIKFDVGDPAVFTITATGTYPTIDPEDAIYDLTLAPPAAVNTTITWREAKNVTSIVDDGDYTLITDTDYTLGDTIEGEAALTILSDPYLDSKLTAKNQSVVLTIQFDFGSNRTFTIRAIDAYPIINPDEAEYDLNYPVDVTANIKWQHPPTEVVSIVDGDDYELEENMDYTVSPNDDGTATLKIDRLRYLRFKMTDGEEVALTIAFNVGDDEEFSIRAVRYPRVDCDVPYYNWDDPSSDFLQASIIWGTAREIDAITDSKGYVLDLARDENGDYIILGNTLVILTEYLRDTLSDWKPVTLTILFSDGLSADLTIKAFGNDATVYPSVAPYARHAPHDVATTITSWGSATNVERIVDDEGYTLGKDAYNVTRIDGDDGTDIGTARLTIFHAPYLEGRFKESQTTSVKLTVDFDVGRNQTFEVTTGCFIATAAYGTLMAEQVQILREFRDEYLVTNSLGRGLVDIYYRISPSIADFISEYPSLKPIVRAGLVPAVAISTAAVNTSPAEKAAIVGLLVLAIVAVGIWVARRQNRRPKCT